MNEEYDYILDIEVYPRIENRPWGLASGMPLTYEEKAKFAHWIVKLAYTDGATGLTHAYYHGDMPSEDDRFWINKQIAEFFYASVIYDKK